MRSFRTTIAFALSCSVLAGCNAFSAPPGSLEYQGHSDAVVSDESRDASLVDASSGTDATASSSGSDAGTDTTQLKGCPFFEECRHTCTSQNNCDSANCAEGTEPRAPQWYWMQTMCEHHRCGTKSACVTEECETASALCSDESDAVPAGTSSDATTKELDTCHDVVQCRRECSTKTCLNSCFDRASMDAHSNYVGLAKCYNGCSISSQHRFQKWQCVRSECISAHDSCFQLNDKSKAKTINCRKMRRCVRNCDGYECTWGCLKKGTLQARGYYRDYIECRIECRGSDINRRLCMNGDKKCREARQKCT